MPITLPSTTMQVLQYLLEGERKVRQYPNERPLKVFKGQKRAKRQKL